MSTTIEPPVSGQDGGNAFPSGSFEPAMSECLTTILQSLRTMKEGDFSVRLPVSWTGLPGKIADNFNDIVTANEQMASELKRVGQAVGKEGKTRERIRVETRRGSWAEMAVSVNTLVDDLLRRGEELPVVGERHDPQGGRVQDGGPAPLEQGAQLLGPARGGDAHGEARERTVLRVLLFVVHGSALLADRHAPSDRFADRACQQRVTGSVRLHCTGVTSHFRVAELRLCLRSRLRYSLPRRAAKVYGPRQREADA